MNGYRNFFFIFMMLIAGILGGGLSNLIWSGHVVFAEDDTDRPESSKSDVSDEGALSRGELEVRKLTIKDNEGHVRAILGLDHDENPRLSFLDIQGVTLMEIGLTTSGGDNPYFILLDQSGRDRMLIAVHEEKDPDFYLFGEKGGIVWAAN